MIIKVCVVEMKTRSTPSCYVLCFSVNPFKGLFRSASLSKEGRARRERHLLRLFAVLIGATVEKVQDVKKAVVNLRSVRFLFSSALIERVVTFG